ncbi:MAG: ABC transporter ATP-binding protein [Candidatus Saccharimonadales bacterium]
MPKLFSRANSSTIKKTLRIYRTEIAKDKKSFWIYATLIPVNRMLTLVLLPLLFSLIIQSLIVEPDNWEHPTKILVIAVVISILALISARIGFSRLFFHEERMQSTLLERAMTALSQHSDQFFANRKVGSLSGDVMKFSHSILNFMDVIFLQASGVIVNFSMSLVVIAFLSPILLVPLAIITVLIVGMSIRGTMRRGPFRHKRKVLTSRLGGVIADIIGNQQIVRYFATEPDEIIRVKAGRTEIEEVVRKEIDIIENESILRQGVLFTFQIVTLGICIWLYTSDSVSIAALIFAITYLGRLTGSLFDISPIIRGTEQAFLDAADITEILSEIPEVQDDTGAKALQVTKGQIQLKAVDFAYQDSQDDRVIHSLTLDIPAGQRVGLAGHSGGGKTTVTKLLLRFADVTKGEIYIDGQNIKDVTQKSLRANIAYVPQEAYLFHRSLRDNVAYGRQNASEAEIETALKRANAWEFVKKLPLGIDTIVGERGVKLSGGQRQRIAIARAILKDAPILVLDEATSALDSQSEKLIQSSLDELMKNRTSIVIAHRLSTIAKLDRIIVLEGGKIAEDGSHAKLLKQRGIYANLWSHQSGGFIEE